MDRYHLLTFPVLLGTGKRLFAADTPAQRLTLLRSADFSNGVRMAVYDVRRDPAPTNV